MPDREKVIRGLEICRHRVISQENCKECPYIYDARAKQSNCEGVLHWDALALLKEQEAVKPVLDEQTGRIWLCGNCSSYVGFEDNDPHDPNEFDKFCRECGRPVLWEGR